jgi:hypothetical protein
MSAGLKWLVVGVVGALAAMVGVVIVGVAIVGHASFDSNGGLKPYGLPETLPKMVASFGRDARVVEIIVSSSGVNYQVIGADHQLHIRDYSIVESEIDAGTYGYNRKTRDFVRTPTAPESHSAVLALGQVDPGVVDTLYSKVGFPRQGSSATLTGRSWFLESGAQPEHRFVAAYNGARVERTEAAAPPDPKSATITTSSHATAPTSSRRSKATTTTVYSFTTTLSSGSTKPDKLNSATQRLVTCIERARGDVNKIAACQRKFLP